jgi:UDP-glucose 4-epimerase
MKTLVTGSAGHLGEALMRTLRGTRDASGRDVIGIDVKASDWTDRVGSIVDREFVRNALRGVDTVLHAATLHKPHVATHSRQEFVDVNVTGTLNLLEESVAAGVRQFVFTSTTSVYGFALNPAPAAAAVWVDEDLVPVPKNIYGITKLAAENLCALFQRKFRLPCIVLRTSRFFPEEDDNAETRGSYADANVKANEFLYRRVDVADIVDAHLLAAQRATEIGFGCYVISATTPFSPADRAALRTDAAAVVARYVPQFAEIYARRGWSMFPDIGRIYDNARARAALGWRPRYDFAQLVEHLGRGADFRSPLAQAIGSKGYHAERFENGPYPVD